MSSPFAADAFPAGSKAAWKWEERRRRDLQKWQQLADIVAANKLREAAQAASAIAPPIAAKPTARRSRKAKP